MKPLIFLALFLTSASSYAAPSFVISQILADKEVGRLTNDLSITKIEETAVYRCPGCFEFTITQRTSTGEQQIIVRTRGNGPRSVYVSVLSVSK